MTVRERDPINRSDPIPIPLPGRLSVQSRLASDIEMSDPPLGSAEIELSSVEISTRVSLQSFLNWFRCACCGNHCVKMIRTNMGRPQHPRPMRAHFMDSRHDEETVSLSQPIGREFHPSTRVLDLEIIRGYKRCIKPVVLPIGCSASVAVQKGAVAGESDQIREWIGQATAPVVSHID